MSSSFVPTQFGRYVLVDRIAIGGMAEIFNAKVVGAMGFEKALVIKRILPQFGADTEFLRMFITEAKLVCHLEHPNIVQVHELGEIDGQYYIAMEYVNGIDARQLWRVLAKRRQRLPGVLALFIVSEFLKGVDYAHRAVGPDGNLLGVVHRDVSPSNILLSYRGDVKIGDFGIALVQQESKTQAGVLKGKFGYMSPEQVAGLKVDHRSDIFAAGIVLAELLLGRRLFLGASDFETLDKVMNVRLDVLEEHAKALAPEAVRIVRQALQRDVNDRYQSAREFHEDITEHLYREGHRITNETLAAFMAEHVTPHLAPSKAEPTGSLLEADAKSPSVSTPSESHRIPIITKDIFAYDISSIPPASSRDFVEKEAASEAAAGGGAASEDAELRFVPGYDPDTDEPAPEADRGTAIPMDHPAFESFPMLDMGQGEEQVSELDLVSPDAEESGASAVSYAPLEGGAGEELDLEDIDEQEFFAMPSEIRSMVPPARARGDGGAYQPGLLVEGMLPAVENQDAEQKPDYYGTLFSRTVTKVLFRFALVEETGLLYLTGPQKAGQQAEIHEWLRQIILRAGASPTAHKAENRTCEIHLLGGQPHLASADRSEEGLVAYLICNDIVSQHRVEMVVKNNPHRRPIAALLSAGSLSPLFVSRHVTAFVLDSVLDTFCWTEGDFAFYRDRPAPGESFPTGQSALDLILLGVTQLSEPFLDAYFDALIGYHLVASDAPPLSFEAFRPDEEQMSIFHALESSRPLDETLDRCMQLASPLRVKQTLYLLIECEMASLA